MTSFSPWVQPSGSTMVIAQKQDSCNNTIHQQYGRTTIWEKMFAHTTVIKQWCYRGMGTAINSLAGIEHGDSNNWKRNLVTSQRLNRWAWKPIMWTQRLHRWHGCCIARVWVMYDFGTADVWLLRACVMASVQSCKKSRVRRQCVVFLSVLCNLAGFFANNCKKNRTSPISTPLVPH